MSTSTQVPQKKGRHLAGVLLKELASSPDHAPIFPVLKLLDINVIPIEELELLLIDFRKRGVIHVLNVNFANSAGFDYFFKQIKEKAYREDGILYVAEGEEEIKKMKVDYFFSDSHHWDTDDVLQIAANTERLQAELKGKLLGEIKGIICVDPDERQIMRVVVNGDYLNSIYCKMSIPAWALLYKIATDGSAPFNKGAFELINRPNNKIFSNSRLPHKNLVSQGSKGVVPNSGISIKRISQATFLRMKTKAGI